jgi:hypothetical protein
MQLKPSLTYTLVAPSEFDVDGCLDPTACNYGCSTANSGSTINCTDGVTVDDRGVCWHAFGACSCEFGPDAITDCVGDCCGDTGDYAGVITCATEDCVGECGGSTTDDCFGECGGVAEMDDLGVCRDCTNYSSDCTQHPDWNSTLDCFEVCGGNGIVDGCGNCVPEGDTSCLDCFDISACNHNTQASSTADCIYVPTGYECDWSCSDGYSTGPAPKTHAIPQPVEYPSLQLQSHSYPVGTYIQSAVLLACVL